MWGSASPLWDAFVRYDSGWYAGIARSGYSYVPDGRSNIAYFPAYPLMMRYVGRLLGRTTADFYIAGIVISWTAFVAAVVVLYFLARLDLTERRARRAVVFATLFPFAFFFGVVYTESVFLLFTVAAFYFFRTRRWIAGGLAGAVASAARPNGILMLPALALLVWRSAEPTRRDRMLAIAGLALVACGIGAYSLFVYRLTSIEGGSHNPLEWAATIERWGYNPGGSPWTGLFNLIGPLATHPYRYLTTVPMAPFDLLNGLAALVLAVSVPFVWARLGAPYGIFLLVNLWLPLSSGQYEGLGRYCSVLFPFHIWLAGSVSRRTSTVILVASAMLYAFCLTLFTNTYPLF